MKDVKIAVLDKYALGYDDEAWREIEKIGDIKFANFNDNTTDQEIIDFAKDAEIVILDKVPFGKARIDALPKLKYITVTATGYNIVDAEHAREKGIILTNVPNYCTMSVVQHTIGLMIETVSKIGLHNASVHNGDWCRSPQFSYWKGELYELDGKTLGIIGYGVIGQAVARTARTLGMKIIAYTNHPGEDTDEVKFVDLDTLFAQSDIITLHCRLNAESMNLINKDNISKMKDGAIIINTSRGPVLNEADVAEALKSGKLSAVAVDVVSQEPILESNPLLTAPNCIITPHIAWAPKEARERLLAVVEENIKSYLEGNPINRVN